jgi:putative salt-induced outer membrane protein
MKLLTAAAILAIGAPAAALAEPIPAGVAAMIEAASKDPANLKVVADIAKQTNPGSAAEIDARLGEIAAAAEAARVESLSNQTFFEGWTGEGEAGGFISTGNAEETGLAVGLGQKKESLKWRHRVDGIADYRSTEGTTTKERYFLGYEGNYKFTDRFYAVGAVSWEKDVFAGIDSRFSESLGLGYRVIDRKDLTLDVDASVAARQVEYVQPLASFPGQDLSESTIGGRLGGRLVWEINENTTLSEVVAAIKAQSEATARAADAMASVAARLPKGRA